MCTLNAQREGVGSPGIAGKSFRSVCHFHNGDKKGGVTMNVEWRAELEEVIRDAHISRASWADSELKCA